MKEFKSIITHPEGQNLFPGQITAIEGYPHGTSITMKNTKPQIALTPYGATQMMPDMNYNFAGNTVVELPQAQMGGQGEQDQLMQLIQMYAQMKGMQPEELIQKIQSLPKEQQQQAIQSIAQEVQQAMAQQQQAEQQEAQMGQQDQEGMMEQQQEMGMAQMGGNRNFMAEGGEPCFDCFDHYNPSPQAQDLNWYYKATGGEAFPQANMYPEDWGTYSGNQYAQGGEAFPQAQTYLPNDRPHETRPNFMFQAGGQSDMDKIYQIMKKGGMDYNPKKKKGGKFDHLKAFNEYLQSGGGKLPYKDINVAEDNYDQMMDERERKDIQSVDNQAYYNLRKNTLLDWDADEGTDENPYEYEKPELTNPIYDREEIEPIDNQSYNKLRESASSNFNSDEGIDENLKENSTYLGNNSSNKAKFKKSKGSKNPYAKDMKTDYLNGMAMATGNKGLFGALAAINNVGNAVGDAAAGWSHPGRAWRGAMGREDKYQEGGSPCGTGMYYNKELGRCVAFSQPSDQNALSMQEVIDRNGKYYWDNIVQRQYPGATGIYEGMKCEDGSCNKQPYYGPQYEDMEPMPSKSIDMAQTMDEDMMPRRGETIPLTPPLFLNEGSDENNNSNRKVHYYKHNQRDAKPYRAHRSRPKRKCTAQGCFDSWQEGGTPYFSTTDAGNSYYEPLTQTIHLSENDRHIPGVVPHETYHYWQDMHGDLSDQDLWPGPLKRPTIPSGDDSAQLYWNRRLNDQEDVTNMFLSRYPEFKFAQPEVVYNRAVNPQMYRLPFTAEGEARNFENHFQGPSPYPQDYGYRHGGGLPKHQAWLSQTGNLSQPSGGYNMWNVQTPAAIENSSAYQGIQQKNQDAVRIADQNIVKEGTDKLGDKDTANTGNKQTYKFNPERTIAGLAQTADFIHNFKRANSREQADKERRNINTSEFMDVAQFGGGQYGDWLTNPTQGTAFRPDEMQYAQKTGRSYKDQNIFDYPTYDLKDMDFFKKAQMGGSILDSYDEEQEYDLSPEEIAEIIAAGGTIEYL